MIAKVSAKAAGTKPRSPGFVVFIDKCGGGRAHWQAHTASPVRFLALNGPDVPWPRPSAPLRLAYVTASAQESGVEARSDTAAHVAAGTAAAP